MRNQGVGSWPERRARRTPDRPALVDGDTELTFADVNRRVTGLAHGLRAEGVTAPDRIAYLGPNGAPLVETMFAAHVLGCVFVPLNTRLTPAELDHQLLDCQVSALVYAGAHASTVRGLAHPPVLLAFHDPEPGADPPGHVLDDLVSADTAPIDEPVALQDAAMILYTSGTTGRPKGATLSHGNLTWNAVNVLVDLDLSHDEVTLASAPLFHVAALNMTLLPTFLKGGRSVLMRSWGPAACLAAVQRHGVTFMFGVPTMFADLTREPDWASADLSSIRTLLAGGAPVPSELISTYLERGLGFLQGYGLTEASPGTMVVPADRAQEKVGSAGVPHFFNDVRIGGTSAEGGVGELLVQGPTVMEGYWHQPEATADTIVDGWLRTGDVATVDADGFVTLVDRVKDIYVSGGENVYPAEVEAALRMHPDVVDCAVVGVPDDRWGEVGHAFVELRTGAVLTPETLVDFLAGRLARYKLPREVHRVAALPRTGSGKVTKAALRGDRPGQRALRE
ncbi:MAG: long-chain fatty acid--CoA ligase [Nocardioides sp.]